MHALVHSTISLISLISLVLADVTASFPQPRSRSVIYQADNVNVHKQTLPKRRVLLNTTDLAHDYVMPSYDYHEEMEDGMNRMLYVGVKAQQQQQQQQQRLLELEKRIISNPYILPHTQQHSIGPFIKPKKKQKLKNARSVMSFAFLAGLCDAVCKRRYDCFVAMMTGNSFRMASAISDCRWTDVMKYSSLVAGYLGGIFTYRFIDRTTTKYNEDRGMKKQQGVDMENNVSISCRAVSATVLSIFLLTDVLPLLRTMNMSITRGLEKKCLPLLAAAFGMINTGAAEMTGGVITFAVTGHLNKLGNAMSRAILEPMTTTWRQSSKDMKIAMTSLKAVLSFLVGIVTGTTMSGVKVFGINRIFNTWPFAIIGVFYAFIFLHGGERAQRLSSSSKELLRKVTPSDEKYFGVQGTTSAMWNK